MRRLSGMIVSMVLVAGCATTNESSGTSAGTTAVPASTTTVASTSTAASTSVASTTTVAPTTSAPVDTVPNTDEPGVAMYFVRDEKLNVVGRWLGTFDAAEVMQALLAGPGDLEQAAGLRSLIPAGTRLLGVTVQGNAATVDLSADFEAMGGSLAVSLAIAQVTYTLTQLPGVDRVWFRIEGAPRDMLTGEGVMVNPATRAEFTDTVLPSIFLEQPFDRSPLANPIVIAGITNAFEATVNYQVLAIDRTVLVEGVTTATCGSGCWGGFTASIALPAGTKGPVFLRVFDYSEADGTTMVDLVEVELD